MRLRHPATRLILALAFAAQFALALSPTAFAARKKDDAPTAAPSFTLPGRDGAVSLESLRGKVVYVDFWASWCVPCQASFPWLKSMHDLYAAKGLAIVAINLDKSREMADQFLARHAAPFLVAFDPAGSTAEAFQVGVMPSSYLIDRNGKILHTQPGFGEKRTAEIERLIQEALTR